MLFLNLHAEQNKLLTEHKILIFSVSFLSRRKFAKQITLVLYPRQQVKTIILDFFVLLLIKPCTSVHY